MKNSSLIFFLRPLHSDKFTDYVYENEKTGVKYRLKINLDPTLSHLFLDSYAEVSGKMELAVERLGIYV